MADKKDGKFPDALRIMPGEKQDLSDPNEISLLAKLDLNGMRLSLYVKKSIYKDHTDPNDNRPDYLCSVEVDGVRYDANAWWRSSEHGAFLYGKTSVAKKQPDGGGKPKPKPKPKEPEPELPEEFDDDIPF